MMFLANIFGGFFSYEYKPIGNSIHISDNYLAWASSASSVVQAVTRVSFGALYDKFGFRPLFMVLMTICTVNSVICYPARVIPELYFVCILVNYMVMAGVFATFPTPAAKTFGPRFGIQVYSLILFGPPIQSVLTTIQVKLLYEVVGMEPLLYTGTVCSFIALLISAAFTERLDLEQMHEKKLLVWTPKKPKSVE